MTQIIQDQVIPARAYEYGMTGNPPHAYTKERGTKNIRSRHSDRTALIRNPASASGWRNPSYYSRTEEDWTDTAPGVVSSHNLDGSTVSHYVNGYYVIGRPAIMTATPAMESSCIIKALAKLKNQDVNLSLAFGERKEAADMMVNTVTGIARSVRRFRTSKPSQWLKVLKYETGHGNWRKIPDEWLEVQYGWKPLMSDLHGACQALNNRERDNDAYRATVKSTLRENGKSQWIKDTAPYNRMDIRLSYEYGVHVHLDYNLDNPLVATLAQLGITNPAELVWELLPYSFVIDWFVPVGNYLSALDAAVGWSFKGGTCTKWARQQGSGLPFGYLYNSYYQGDGGSQRYTSRQFTMQRTVYQTSPLPRFPGLKNPFPKNGIHIANAMSLLVSAFR